LWQQGQLEQLRQLINWSGYGYWGSLWKMGRFLAAVAVVENRIVAAAVSVKTTVSVVGAAAATVAF
jgi:hypothetical protein